MKEWKLVRIRDGFVSMIYYQRTQPDFNPAFGREEEFRWESRTMSAEEIQEERNERRRRQYPDFLDLLVAVYAREKGNENPMAALVARIDDIHNRET